MKFKIKNRFTGSVIFSLETESLKLCIEAAWKSRADLSGANLSGAYLSGAYLSEAGLSRADLSRANLSRADLSKANLSGADLSEADLSRADLSRAYLSGANLSGAYLSGADLSGANLSGAYLSGAYLSGANGINKNLCTPLLFLSDQPRKIRAYKLVNADMEGPYNGGIKYQKGKIASVEDANTDDTKQCAAGINISTLDWCMREWREGYRILIVEFTAKDIAAIPIATDGKFRVHRCKVVGEKDLKEIGLIPSAQPSRKAMTATVEGRSTPQLERPTGRGKAR